MDRAAVSFSLGEADFEIEQICDLSGRPTIDPACDPWTRLEC
jgi:hypothetical protein